MIQGCFLEAALGERIGLLDEEWELIGPLLPALGNHRRIRCHAGDAGWRGGARCQRRHDRQHDRPGTSLCSRHKKGAQQAEGLGRSRGGFTTKLHVWTTPAVQVLSCGDEHRSGASMCSACSCSTAWLLALMKSADRIPNHVIALEALCSPGFVRSPV